jgi:tetratricopeptide (TPR) repeat protein
MNVCPFMRRSSYLAPLVVVLVAACLSLAVSLPAAADETMPASRVLVMPFSADVDAQAPGAAGAALWLGEAAAVLLTENLSHLGVATFSRDDRVAAFARLQVPMSSALTRATMIRVGEIIGASDIVFGQIHLDDQLSVTVRTIRLASARESPSVKDASPLEDIFDLFTRVATQVGAPLPKAATPTAEAARLPLDAFESYVKGLVAATPAAQQRFLETASRLAPRDPHILMALWSMYASQGLHEKALAVANAVPADSPGARDARYAVGHSLIDLKRYDGAFQELNALYARYPLAAVSNAIGVVQLRRDPLPGASPATVYFSRAVREAPDNTQYLFNLGYAYALAHNGTDALTWLRQAVRFNAADGDAHLVMSAVLATTGRQTEAQREFDLARQLGTTTVSSVTTLPTRVPTGLERLDENLAMADVPEMNARIAAPARTDQLETAAFHVDRARDLIEAHRDREATDELRRAIYLAPYEDAAHLLLGGIYQRSGQTAQAIDEFRVSLWCRETAQAHVALGGVLLDTGDRDGARREASRALALAPGAPEAQALAARIDR